MVRASKRLLESVTEDEEVVRVTDVPQPRKEHMLNAVLPQNSMDGYVAEISRLWGEAKEKFLAIGEYLLMAKDRLPHGEYEEMIRSRLPFNPATAHKMRQVADAVRKSRIERAELPHSYTTAYELTTLDDRELVVARQRNLVRPDVLRRDILAFRAEFRAPQGRARFAALQREQQSLERELERIRARLHEIQTEMEEVTDAPPAAMAVTEDRATDPASLPSGPSAPRSARPSRC